MSEALLQADIDRVYGEYHAARAAYEATPKDSPDLPVVSARWKRAQRELNETRDEWRLIGEAVGTRGGVVNPARVPPEGSGMIRTVHNSPPPPDLIGIHIQQAGEAGTPAAFVDNNLSEG